MKYQNVLLDFDGTVCESGVAIIESVKAACEAMGLTEGKPWENWKLYIGPTVYRYCTTYLGLSEEERDVFMAHYSGHYKNVALYHAPLYEGMRELLEDLKTAGAGVYLCTSKPEELTLRSVEHLGLHFDGIVAQVGERVKKTDVIGHCLRAYGLDPASCVMIGDRASDVEGGHALGTAGIGVTFGYGSEEEIEGCGAEYVAHSAAELRKILMD